MIPDLQAKVSQPPCQGFVTPLLRLGNPWFKLTSNDIYFSGPLDVNELTDKNLMTMKKETMNLQNKWSNY